MNTLFLFKNPHHNMDVPSSIIASQYVFPPRLISLLEVMSIISLAPLSVLGLLAILFKFFCIDFAFLRCSHFTLLLLTLYPRALAVLIVSCGPA